MFSWQWPWVFILLPLPLLVRWFMPSNEQAPQAIRVPFFDQLRSIQAHAAKSQHRVWLQASMASLIWLGLVSAAAQPTWVGEPVPIPQDRRDLMLAVDISGSMQERDMRVNNGYASRIDAVKYVVGEFIQRRAGDRIGLILFGEQAYLQTPLTFDTKTVNQQLGETQLGFAGNATAIGEAIGLSIKKLRDRPAESRVLVLLTDGANSAGTDPRQAMNVAAEANIRIHTIGIGAPRRGRAAADIDEQLLIDIANTTSGQYFRARDPNELQQIYAEIDRLEPMPEEQTFRPSKSLSYWPLSASIALSIVMAIGRILRANGFTLRPINEVKE